MHAFYRYVYSRPLWKMALLVIFILFVWTLLRAIFELSRRPRAWRIINCVLLIPAAAVVLYATLGHRSADAGTHVLILRPFTVLESARTQPECYREIFMNAFLFGPFGLTVSTLWTRRFGWGKAILLTLLSALLCSVGLEVIQYVLCIGTAETDDVICNVLGAAVGAAHLLLAYPVTAVFRALAGKPSGS